VLLRAVAQLVGWRVVDNYGERAVMTSRGTPKKDGTKSVPLRFPSPRMRHEVARHRTLTSSKWYCRMNSRACRAVSYS
jgi:hypothetical protein